MRIIRRYLAALIALSVTVCSNLTMPVFADDTPAALSKRYYDAQGLLMGMGVLGENMSEEKADEPAKRAEIAELLIKITSPGTKKFSGRSYFSDVTPDTFGYDAVNLLYEQGIAIGVDTSLFCPDDTITSDQMAKLLVAALGYTNMAEAGGGYPSGYLGIAYQLDLFEGVSGKNEMTKQNAVIMIYNALSAGIQIVSVKGDGNAEHKISDDENLLSVNFDIYKMKGRITENSQTSLTGESTIGENEVLINGIRMNAGDTNAGELLGYEVTVYYKSDDDNESGTIVYITDIDRNETVKIDVDDIVSYENGVYTYEINGKNTRRAKIGTDADIIYNGKATVFDEKYLVPTEGYVELIRSKGSTDYNTVLISDIKNIVVNSVNADKAYVSGKYGADALVLDNSLLDRLSLKNTNGEDITLDDIFEWDVISYIKSADGKVINATVVREYAAGTVNSVNNEEGSIEIAGNSFKISKNFPNIDEYTIKTGDKGDFLLDITGKIAAFVKSETQDFVYGYLIRVWHEDDDSVGVKMLCADRGSIRNFAVADKVKIDGKTSKTVYDPISVHEDEVIRYKLNSEGKVCEIDSTDKTPDEESGTSLFISSPMPSSGVYFKKGSINGRAVMNGNTYVFVVPSDRSAYDMYKVKSMSVFRDNYTYQIQTYNTEKEYSYAEAALFYSNNGDGSPIVYNTYIAMIEKVNETIDDEGIPCCELTYGISGRKETITANETVRIKGSTKTMYAKDLTPGSVIRIGTDYQSRADEVELLYLADKDLKGGEFKAESVNPNSAYNETVRYIFGYVYLTKDGVIKITTEDPAMMSSFDSSNTESRILGNFKCMMLDTTGRTPVVRTANQVDFLDYIHYGSERVKVIVQTKNMETLAIMIVK